MLADRFNRQFLTKLAIRLLALIILVLIGRFLYDVLATGTLSVTASHSNTTIVVSSLPPQKQGSADRNNAAFTKKGTGSLTVHVHAGTYIVFAQNGDGQTGQTVKVGWLSHVHVSINTADPTPTEPVLYDNVQNLVADSSHMAFLSNTDENHIEQINSQNQESAISDALDYTSVAWATPTYGVAQDNTGSLFVINGTDVEPLKTPLSGVSDLTSTTVAVAPDKTIYIGYGSYVYRGTDSGNFQTIYRNFASSDSLVATNGKVMIVTPNTSNASGGSATVIDTNGKQVTKNFGYSLGGWTPWSPNGNYIVITVGSIAELFDASLKQVGTLPELNGVNGGAWLDDNTLFYASSGQLCAYDISKGDAVIKATMPDNDTIQSIVVSADGSYVYVTASSSSSGATPSVVLRVGLRGQAVSGELSTLQDVLPISGSDYSVGLRNFAGTPTIDVTAFPGTDPNDALQSAQDAVQGIVNLNDVNFDVTSGD